jgi:hypothetical protein
MLEALPVVEKMKAIYLDEVGEKSALTIAAIDRLKLMHEIADSSSYLSKKRDLNSSRQTGGMAFYNNLRRKSNRMLEEGLRKRSIASFRRNSRSQSRNQVQTSAGKLSVDTRGTDNSEGKRTNSNRKSAEVNQNLPLVVQRSNFQLVAKAEQEAQAQNEDQENKADANEMMQFKNHPVLLSIPHQDM